MPPFDIERTAVESRKAIEKIAATGGMTFDEALDTPEGRRIAYLTERLAAEPVEKAAPGPGYLLKAAQEIAHRDGISVEAAYGRIQKERPELAARYRAET